MLEQNRKVFGWMLAIFAVIVLANLAFGDLTATVYPGYTFGASERPTTATLNLAARPTVVVSGTLGGTNVGLAANSVSGAMLMTSVVDDSTIEFYDSGGATTMRVKAYNIGTNVLGSNVAGSGLTGGAGTALAVNVDASTVRITNDVVTLGTNVSLGHFAAGDATAIAFYSNLLTAVTFTSSSVAVNTITADGLYINEAHGLGVVPKWIRAVLTCTTADNGYVAGDQVDAAAIDFTNAGTAEDGSAIAAWCNATNVGVTIQAPASGWLFANKTNGATVTPTAARWTLKIYARP